MSDDEESIHKLSGYNHTEGGLIIKKKPKPAEQFEFKVPDVPKGSLLGLDKLAGKSTWLINHSFSKPTGAVIACDRFTAQKRLDREAEKAKNSKLQPYTDNDDEDQEAEDYSNDNPKHRVKSR